MTAVRFDIVVIGAGPGGYVAALRAANHGLSVAVVERDSLGGVCANEGCIPTMALLRCAEVYATVRDAAQFGVRVEGVSFDLASIVGAGAIGVEFASFYRTLGVEVTLVEMLPHVLPQEDEEISEAMARALKKSGIRVLTSAAVVSMEKSDEEVRVVLEAGGKTETISAQRLLVATGIVANLEGLGLEATRVVVERGRIVVDEWMRTAEPGVYAIGDITGAPWLAHKASAEAAVCVDGIAGAPGALPLPRGSIPACTYASPQVASIGLTEAAARAAGLEVRCGRASFVANGKARALGDTTGFVKTVFDAATGELLGAHLIGPEVTELVSTFALARTLEATEAELLATVFPHPTLSEAMHESVAAAFARHGLHSSVAPRLFP